MSEFLDFELEGIANKDYLIINSKIEYKIDNSNYVFPWEDKISKITFNSFGLDPISDDIISLYYKADFSDSFSESIISLADHSSHKRVRKKLSYLMIEVFQYCFRLNSK